jgi:hypothetical protein
MLALRWVAVFDEVLERRKRSWPHPLELVRGDRFEQLSDDSVLQDDLSAGREEGSLAFGVNGPLVPCVRDEWYANAFVGKSRSAARPARQRQSGCLT